MIVYFTKVGGTVSQKAEEEKVFLFVSIYCGEGICLIFWHFTKEAWERSPGRWTRRELTCLTLFHRVVIVQNGITVVKGYINILIF